MKTIGLFFVCIFVPAALIIAGDWRGYDRMQAQAPRAGDVFPTKNLASTQDNGVIGDGQCLQIPGQPPIDLKKFPECRPFDSHILFGTDVGSPCKIEDFPGHIKIEPVPAANGVVIAISILGCEPDDGAPPVWHENHNLLLPGYWACENRYEPDGIVVTWPNGQFTPAPARCKAVLKKDTK
jgi:hypothetical protein